MSKIVLCVDDSATMQQVADITFRGTEFQYVGARSVDEAMQKARQVDALCHRVAREFVAAIRASAVGAVRARPVQMHLAEPEPLRVGEGAL